MTPLTPVDQQASHLVPNGLDEIPKQRVPNAGSKGKASDPVDFTPVRNLKAPSKEPTRLGRYVLARMGELGMARQVDLVRASGISESTVSRIVLHPNYTPDRDTLVALAGALRVDPKELVLFVFDLQGAPVTPPTLIPRAMEVDRFLGPTSHLDETDREFLDTMLDRLIAPLRDRRRPRRAG